MWRTWTTWRALRDLRGFGGGGGRSVVSHRDLATRAHDDGRRDDQEGDDGDDRADGMALVRTERVLDDGRRDEHGHQVHHLDGRVDRRAGSALERVADRVTDDGRGVRLAALAAVVAVLDHLLRVVPGTAGVRE